MSSDKKRILESLDQRPVPSRAWRRSTRWFPGFVILLLAIFMTFFEKYFLPVHMPVVGRRSPEAIRAPYDFVFDEQRAMKEVAEQELKEFVPVYVFDTDKTGQIPSRWGAFFGGLDQCRQRASVDRKDARACLRSLFKEPPSVRAMSELIDYPHTGKMYTMLLTSLKEQLNRGILDDGRVRDAPANLRVRSSDASQMELKGLSELATLSEARKVLGDNLELLQISPDLQKALFLELNGALEANLLYDERNEETRDSLANKAVENDIVLYRKGDLLVRRGQLVTLLDSLRVQDCLRKPAPKPLWTGAASFLPFLLLTLLFVLISQRFHTAYQGPGWFAEYSPSKSYLLVFSVLLSILFLARILYLFTNVSGFAVPVGAAGIVVTLLLNPVAGVLAALLASIYVTLLTSLDMGLFLYYLIPSLLLVLFTARSPGRIPLLLYTVLVGFLNVVLFACAMLLREQLPNLALLRQSALFSFLSAPAAWVIAVLVTPLGERLFRLTTPDRLRDLCDLNHPLLRKLQDKAPGTYYHSLAVANLACVAAEAVGADVFLVRVGAYYHDIGKVVQPQYFIENQSNRENPHDNMDPRISCDIVKTHVGDGVSIAREYGLPASVVDLIAEHHGTTVLETFFLKAQQNPAIVRWNRDFFRYDGPTPTTIEAGILMIADVAEAMFRVSRSTNPMEVRERLHGVIVKKFEHGQFDYCALPTSTLAVVEAAIMQALLGILHERIEYPDDKVGEERSSSAG